jgi:hypothetical protein
MHHESIRPQLTREAVLFKDIEREFGAEKVAVPLFMASDGPS